METNPEIDLGLEGLNQKMSGCIEAWKMEYQTREGAKPDYTQQKQLEAIIKESIEGGNRLRVVMKKTEGNAKDIGEFDNKVELPNGEYEVEVRSLLNPGGVISEKPAISVPPERSEVSIEGSHRRLVVLYPDEIVSMTVSKAKAEAEM